MSMSSDQHKPPYPCRCGGLESAADEPDNPIIFQADLNEFQIEYSTEEGPGHMMIHYCPFCGGKPPDSRRSRLFARITRAELRRLRDLTTDIRTLEDAVRILGEPDQDEAEGMTVHTPGSENEPPVVRSYRMLRYNDHSDTAVIEITDYLKDKVDIGFQGKYLRREVLQQGDDGSPTKSEGPEKRGRKKSKQTLYCNFCGKSQHGVRKLIAGPGGAFICNECVDLCLTMLDD